MTETTYILTHGAWSGAWSWREVGAELTMRGVPWSALDLPSSTHGAHPNTFLADDAREVAAVARLDGPVVLVGHSYGGAVITEAAPDISNLVGLVYIAALVPELGQSTTECARQMKVRTLLDEAIELDGDFLRLDPAKARDALYQDCDEAMATWALAQLSTQTLASFRSPRAAYAVQVPSNYVICTLDQAVDPLLQETLASRCDEAVHLESGHSPLLSRPDTLCDLILSAKKLDE
jgi:pimeloyl-ACP methyl ester carboxylesterase